MTGPITGSAILTRRLATGLSQRELAELLGVRAATVSDWEMGKHRPNPLGGAYERLAAWVAGPSGIVKEGA